MISSKIRLLSFFFITVLLLGALASCGNNGPYWKFTRKLEPLTEEQIEECNAAYRVENLGTYDEYVGSKSEDMREQVEKVYFGLKFIQNNVYTPYLGTFGGAIVVGTSLAPKDELYVLGDHRLEMGSLKKITVYKSGKFVSLLQAYNSDWITDADVQIIEERIALYQRKLEK